MDAPLGERTVVLFDLFNTLIPGGTAAERDAVSREIGHDLGVDPERFSAAIRDSFGQRMRGELGDLTDTLRALAAGLGATPDDAALRRAGERRLALTRQLQRATWALPTLDALRRRGHLIGVVSDCSAETPAVWGDGPLAARVDAVSFSCENGRCKPDPEAYLVAVRMLDTRADECVFVGDGASDELAGARALGMRAIRYRGRGSIDDTVGAPDRAAMGETIDDLSELLT